ncbi:pyrimidine/purine nucleoside phosphorylase [Pseudomonas sp. C27(2019)]|mgnify:CR=1 FL=1|uniref:pyrimidine/purine nucleoside phosphorylase n=1 Tax=Pseudomonas sp. C27(2019) TaxID=2604941 RepID=UPI001243B9C6|nr:pyrimidine/purine nucleoside phosphorylase [Pseudomonas sp. C27(2019)]QEY58400.1 pyrimidine/purine nucleoside phosphorylase [Pseudomonas sp. C27(2019)]
MLNVNEYFNGAVKSISFTSGTSPASVGVITLGEYNFATASAETMHIISGSAEVKLANTGAWIGFNAGDHFKVAANSSFLIRVKGDTAYLCEYC